ncbi:hypothetical protein V5O48_012353, partial [Marasmius crinis-equi]
LDLATIFVLIKGVDDDFPLYNRVIKINNGNLIAIAAFSLLLAFMTGGRIWWVSSQARQLMGRPINAKYRAIVATMYVCSPLLDISEDWTVNLIDPSPYFPTNPIARIESGILYAGTMVFWVVTEFTLDATGTGADYLPFDTRVISAIMTGLAPTLIIVRVAYGKSIDSVGQMVSTIQFDAGLESRSESRAEAEDAANVRIEVDLGPGRGDGRNLRKESV